MSEIDRHRLQIDLTYVDAILNQWLSTKNTRAVVKLIVQLIHQEQEDKFTAFVEKKVEELRK